MPVEGADNIEVFFVVEDNGYGRTLTGPYKREQDAKGVMTRLRKQHGG